MLAQQLELLVPFSVRRGQHAAIARRHDLARVEGEHGHVAAAASDLFPLAIPHVFRANGAGGVFDDFEVVLLRDRDDGREVGRHAHLVNQKDRLRFRRDCSFDQGRVHVVGRRIDVDEHRLGAAIADRVSRRDVGVRHGDDFIALADARHKKGEVQAGRAVGDGGGVLDANVLRELLLEGGDFRALRDPARENDARCGFRFAFVHDRFDDRDHVS